ncbi:hypothetical protein KESI111651_12800 [Kerstersia similis]
MQLRQNFRHAEKADHRGDVRNPRRQFQAAESEARLRRQRIQADRTNQHTQRAGKHALGDRTAGQAAYQQQAPGRQQQVFTRPEGQREFRHHGRGDGQHRDSDEAADHRYHGRQADGQAGLAPLGNRITIQRSGDLRRPARDVQQDGGARAAIDAAQVNPGNQHQRFIHRPFEGEGNQDGDRHGDRQARNGANVDACERTDCRHHQQLGIRPGDQEILQCIVHFRSLATRCPLAG